MARRAEISTVYAKEIQDALRDRRTLYAMVLLPILIYPLLIAGSGHLWRRQERQLRSEILRVAVEGDLPRLAAVARLDSLLWLVRLPEEAVRDGRVDAWVSIPERLAERDDSVTVRVVYNGSDERSSLARERIEGALDSLRTDLLAERAHRLGVPIDPRSVLASSEKNLASRERMTGARLGSLVPFLLILFLFSSGSYAALDAFAGERERGTLEPLLATAASRSHIVAGKFLAVLTVNLGAALLNLLSLVTTVSFSPFAASLDAQMEPALFAWTVPLLVVLAVPLGVFATAILIVIASSAKSFREGQYLSFPLLIFCIVPAMAGNFPGIEDVWAVYFVPIANVSVVARQVLLGEFVSWRIVATIVVTTAVALLGIRRAARVLSTENAVTGGSVLSPLAAESASGVRAVLFFVIVDFLLFFHVGSLLQARALFPGLAASLVFLLLVPAIVFLKILGLPIRRAVRLRVPQWHALAGAALLAPALALIGQGAYEVVSRVLPVPQEFLKFFSDLAAKEQHGALATYLVLAVSPAICEEFVFRGVVLGLLSRVWSPARAIVVSAALFAVFHLSVYRVLPVFLVGLAVGIVAWRARSLIPAMLLHGLYNAVNVALSREEVPMAPLATRIWLAVALGLAAFLLLRRVRPPRGADDALHPPR
jgi:sodium transport system permease protein